MFTGLVQAKGAIVSRIERGAATLHASDVVELVIESAEIAPKLAVGDSVSVSGVCLTATRIEAERFHVDVAQETLRRTTLSELAAEHRVNLELALRADAPLGGHFVQGHVDGVGRVGFAGPRDGDYCLRVEDAHDAKTLVVEKGSIAIDGVSLTVTACGPAWLEVMLIPHTLESTTLGRLKAGDGVNLEYDILAKYIVRIAGPYLGPRGGGASGFS